eukprot:12182540-Heterocapsa_arctica.AAC.1
MAPLPKEENKKERLSEEEMKDLAMMRAIREGQAGQQGTPSWMAAMAQLVGSAKLGPVAQQPP